MLKSTGPAADAVPGPAVRRSMLRTWPVGETAFVVAMVAANLAWVLTQRRGQPLDIDEAGYAAISFSDLLAFHAGGLVEWWRQIVAQPVQAPLAPALASLVGIVTGPRVLNVFTVSIGAYGTVLAATFGLTRQWPRRARWATALLVAGSPVLLSYSRSFNFAELASANLAGALYFAHRSRCFSRTAPSLAWGGCLGLLLLSRTMTVAFLPGLVLAAALPVLARRSTSGLWRVGGGLLVGAVVASSWYVHNATGVYDYLTSAGYGGRAAQYGPARDILSPGDWAGFLVTATNEYLMAGAALLVLAGWLACAALALRHGVRTLRTAGGPGLLADQVRRGVAQSPPMFTCAVVATCGVVALMSSRNQGSAFLAPLVAPMAVVAVGGLAAVLRRVGPSSPGRGATQRSRTTFGVSGAVGVAALMAAVSSAATFLPLSIQSTAGLSIPGGPVASHLVLWDSRGTLRAYEDGGDVPPSVEANPGSAETGRSWLAASAFVVDEIRRRSESLGRPPVGVITFSDRMINVNTLGLDALVRHRDALELLAMQPQLHGDTASYLAAMRPADPLVTVVVTTTAGPDGFTPAVPEGIGAAYARSLHFLPFAHRRLPDGRHLVLWGPP